jgi:hypothetical protein
MLLWIVGYCVAEMDSYYTAGGGGVVAGDLHKKISAASKTVKTVITYSC